MAFKDAKVSTKILTIVAGFGFALSAVSVAGWVGLEMTTTAAKRIELAAEDIHHAAQLDHDVLNLNRLEFRFAADPREFEQVRERIREDQADFTAELAILRSHASGEAAEILSEIDQTYSIYIEDIEHNIELAEASQFELSDAQRQLLNAIEASVPLMNTLEGHIAEYVELTEAQALHTAHLAQERAHLAEWLILATGALSIILGVISAVFVSRKFISRPLQAVVHGLTRVAEGDLNHEITADARKDEIGELNIALQKFLTSSREKLALMQAQERENLAKIERAELAQRLTESFQVEIAEAITSLAGAAEEMQATAVSMSATAEETSVQTQSVSSVTVQTSANVQTVASAAEEMYAAISSVSEQMSRSTGVTSEAKDRTNLTREQLNTLSASASSIGEILDLITHVTAQTKLLALNATIEAVRAGDAGKGFNVVALEVKALADQTEQATHSVTEKIHEIQRATEAIVSSVSDIGAVVENVSDITTIVAASTEEQVASTGEISKNMAEAATGTNQIVASISMLEDAAQTTASASVQVTATAEELAHQSLNIKNRIDRYLADMAAA